MEYRTLGKTNEKVSTIGMGGWRIGNYNSPEEKAEQVRAIKKGLDLGINLIDTAEIYGQGRSEQLIGEVVHDRRDSVFIATKVSADHLAYDDVIAACKRSLERLGTTYVDLYQVHWPNPSIPISETMRAMEELVREGKVRFVGVSNFSVEDVREAHAALARNELASNQVEYSLTNRSVEKELLPFCGDEGITLIAYSPLARGVIPENHVPEAILQKYRMTTAQVMLNWITRDDQVVAIPKAGRADHMEENARSVDIRLSQDEYLSLS